MEITRRKSINDKLLKYDCLSKEDDFIEVTEWTNGEGIDITMNSHGQDIQFSLTRGQLEAINYLKMSLDYLNE